MIMLSSVDSGWSVLGWETVSEIRSYTDDIEYHVKSIEFNYCVSLNIEVNRTVTVSDTIIFLIIINL